jgi:flagellar biosynthetic protein FliQ
MTPEMVVDIGRQAVYTMLIVSAPMLGFALLVGLGVSILQAVTQINEMTLTFVPKIIAVTVALVVFLPWIIKMLVGFTRHMYGLIGGL